MGRRNRAKREADMQRLLEQLRAAGKLDMIEHDGAIYIHIPEAYRHSAAAAGAYLLSCLPEQATQAAVGSGPVCERANSDA